MLKEISVDPSNNTSSNKEVEKPEPSRITLTDLLKIRQKDLLNRKLKKEKRERKGWNKTPQE